MKNQFYHVLDSTTPWYEYLSYLECCVSLGVESSLTRWIRYTNYYRSVSNVKNISQR